MAQVNVDRLEPSTVIAFRDTANEYFSIWGQNLEQSGLYLYAEYYGKDNTSYPNHPADGAVAGVEFAIKDQNYSRLVVEVFANNVDKDYLKRNLRVVVELDKSNKDSSLTLIVF